MFFLFFLFPCFYKSRRLDCRDTMSEVSGAVTEEGGGAVGGEGERRDWRRGGSVRAPR